MDKLMLEELPYLEDSARLFEAISDCPWAVFLDSGLKKGQGRYDILAAEPFVTLTTRGAVTEIRSESGSELSPEDPFLLLRRYLEPLAPANPSLPFCGGALGYFGYDLARRLERLPVVASDAEKIPEMAVAIYDWAVVVDHRERCACLVSSGRDPKTRGRWNALLARFRNAREESARIPFRVMSPVASNMSRERYGLAFDRIKQYIRAGDCYQVNLAQRFSASACGDPWLAYRDLRRLNPAPYCAYLNTPWAQVLSSSPECFLKVEGGIVETMPIKGTRPRSPDPKRDAELALELRLSAKDRAENLMIVDLLRNDLGKSCEPGTVQAPKLFQIESYASVHHLVSTVIGKLAPGKDALDLLRGCFPGGSITGAPKLRAMQIIEELEPNRRGVYCGAIGYIGFDGSMQTNIAIRTMVYSNGIIRFWAGGGIVADSQVDAEYQETFDKAQMMLKLLDQEAVASAGG